MASGDPKTLVTGIRNTTGAAIDNAEVLVLDLQTNTEDVVDLDNTAETGLVPSVVIPRFEHQSTIADDEYCSGVAAGLVKAKVDGSDDSASAGALLQVTTGSNKFTPWGGSSLLSPVSESYLAVAPSTAITGATETAEDFDETATIDAASLKVGDVVHIRAQGIHTAQTSTETHDMRLRFDDTVTDTSLNDQTSIDPATNDIFYYDASVVIRTATTAYCTGVQCMGVLGTATAKPFITAEFTVDLTKEITIAVEIDRGVTTDSASARLDFLHVQIERPNTVAGIVDYVTRVRGIATSSVSTDTEADVIVFNNPLMMGV
jgi:hypothetical protein